MLFAKCIYLAGLIVWIGEIIFLSFVVAPSAFRLLPRELAGGLLGALFPIYYVIGCVCGVLLLLSCVWLRRTATRRRLWDANAALVTLMLALNLYAAVAVQPRAADLRVQLHAVEPPAGAKAEFDGLHSLAVSLNVVVLLAGIAASGITASALRP